MQHSNVVAALLWEPLQADAVDFVHLEAVPGSIPRAALWVPLGPNCVADEEADFCSQLSEQLLRKTPPEWRDVKGRPIEELIERKERVKALLRRYDKSFEGRFGRLPNRHEKEPMRSLYELYRLLKAAASKAKSADTEAKLQELLAEKAELGKELQTFADAFERANGRKVKFARDILPVDDKYKQYKKLKHVRPLHVPV